LGIADFSKDMISRTNNSTQKIQYRTNGFHNYLRRTRSQRNTKRELLCVAVTMADIYPDESWNFVYGEALPNEGVGVYSFARLDPLFFSSSQNFHTISLTEEHRVIIFRRCLKILLHEIGHLFGLEHCIYYSCLMNGANHEKEMDREPLYLCPVCLRKLYSILQFDVRQRYEKLAKLCEKYGLEEESIWYRKRLDCIQE
jgi:archaemetzincin